MNNASRSSNWPVAVLVMFSFFAVGWYLTKPEKPELQVKPVLQQRQVPPSPEQIAGPHLQWADRECERLIEEHLLKIDETCFVNTKEKTRRFADEALGFWSQWRLVADYVPFTKGDRHQIYLREKFEDLVLNPLQLERDVKQIITAYLQDVESIENQMLVRIRADVADLPSLALDARFDEAALQAKYKNALDAAMTSTGYSLGQTVAIEMISGSISKKVLTIVAIRFGASPVILGVGASASWATAGISLVAAAIIDQIISWIWDWYADPEGELANNLDEKLQEIKCLIIEGSDDNRKSEAVPSDSRGLRKQLQDYARERAIARRQGVLSTLHPQ